MSGILHEGTKSGLAISRYIGPEIGISVKEEPWTGDRRRYQVTKSDGMLLTFSRGEWLDLAEFFGSTREPA